MIDTTFDFRSDTPPGRDPDTHSPTLRRYHQVLWSRPLPNGDRLTLEVEPRVYLSHRSGRGTLHLASDAITTRLVGRASRVLAQIPPADLPEDLGYTIGSAIVFPGDRIDARATINGARGLHPKIADRFDLTLECIRRHYSGGASPLSEVLLRYRTFFDLFESFDAYVDFFLLHDLLDGGRVRFLHAFDDFTTPAVPRTVADYLAYVRASNAFIQARNRRIDALAV